MDYCSLQRIHWQLLQLVDFEHHQLQVPGATGGRSSPAVQPLPAAKLLLAPLGLIAFPCCAIALFPCSVLEVPLHVAPVHLHYVLEMILPRRMPVFSLFTIRSMALFAMMLLVKARFGMVAAAPTALGLVV